MMLSGRLNVAYPAWPRPGAGRRIAQSVPAGAAGWEGVCDGFVAGGPAAGGTTMRIAPVSGAAGRGVSGTAAGGGAG